MRITNQTILRGYNRNINRIAEQKTNSMQKIWSGRDFNRASEAPLSAAKALNVRRQLYNTAQYTENLKTANKFYTEAETSLLQVSEDLALIRETLVAACNTYKDRGDLAIYAQQLETKAKSLVSIFNTDSAGRVIYGGSNNDQMPFNILEDANGNAVTVTYNGVPINAYNDARKFPCSDDVYIDIGLGMVINQETQKVDPQSVLKISFNGAEVSGCGAESGFADIDINSIGPSKNYALDVYADNIKKTVYIRTGTSTDKQTLMGDIAAKIKEAYQYEDINVEIDPADPTNVPENTMVIDTETGTITIDNKTVCIMNNPNADPDKYSKLDFTNEVGYTDNYRVGLIGLEANKTYSFVVECGDKKETITFTAAESTGTDGNPNGEYNLKDTVTAINQALKAAFGADNCPHIDEDGIVTKEGEKVTVRAVNGDENVSVNREKTYSENYIQLTLDAAKALRNGDIEYANGCIDRIVNASESLLIKIADMGCSEEFIDFNINRLEVRDTNLKERQDDLEAVDPEYEITLLKQFEAIYNACLQMSSMTVGNSIFNYI
ncbi:MAG: hypothetical protein K2O14_09420 [Oscillospiraceae bacterium]|nr:hypothetical protein [Oscillospiraceae bacterium]